MGEPRRSLVRRRLVLAWLTTFVLFVIGANASAQRPGVEHVVVIGVDGLSPDGIRKAETPHLHRLMKSGASTLHARGVMPTVSSHGGRAGATWGHHKRVGAG
jgi:predicted AlkP superfamily pyrophosphatase or phosphodiesterase